MESATVAAIEETITKIDEKIGTTFKLEIKGECHYHLNFNVARLDENKHVVCEPQTLCFKSSLEVMYFLTGYVAGYGRARSIF